MRETHKGFLVYWVFLSVLFHFAVPGYSQTCPNPARVVAEVISDHATIQEAYDHASSNWTDFTLLLTDETIEEDLIIDGGNVILDGGYDCTFSAKTSVTNFLGSVTISLTGSAIFSDIRITSSSICAFDSDGDGFTSIGSCSGSADDCDDNNPNIHPGALDTPYDGIDQDCSGADLTFTGEGCVNCHAPASLWNSIHDLTTPPDGTCATCHAAQVSNVLSGHYGRTVRTADNNMTVGSTIDCVSCHDQDINTHGGGDAGVTNGNGSNFITDKIIAVWPNITCDTCHYVRAAAHATNTAHNNRLISNECILCHTLNNQADIDTLHLADCGLCHNYTGTKLDAGAVRQAIQNGLNGTLIACTTCHIGIMPGVNHGNPTSGKHQVHLALPSVGCPTCHGTIPYFKSGTDSNGDGLIVLSETDVCDPCHSPGGAYDGVDDPVIGAKGNWVSGVYDGSALLQGKEKWCVGCHDDGDSSINEGSEIDGVIAPNIAGDDVSYGFYKTGHGKHVNGQAITCLACHDPGLMHVDGDARTYSAAADNYQVGYRLKWVDGEAPLEVPRPINVLTAEQFRLCFSCHDSGPFLNFDNTDTNFRRDVDDSCVALDPLLLSDKVNMHNFHLWGRGGFPWDSDWDGETGDSAQSCSACHNVHGPRLRDGASHAPAMIRTGELIGRESSLNLDYFTSDCPDRIISATNELFDPTGDSKGGVMKFYAPGAGYVERNGVCAMCHNEYQRYWREAKDILSCGKCHMP